MPTRLKRIDSISKDVEQFVRRTEVKLYWERGLEKSYPIAGSGHHLDSFDNVRLSGVQSHIYHDALILNALVWHDSLLSLGYTREQYSVEDWLQIAVKFPVVPLLTYFKQLDKQLLLSVADDNYRLGTFKQYLRSMSMVDVGPLFKPLHRAMVGWFSYRDLDSFVALHECFSFMTRLSLPDRKDLELAAHADYIKQEESLQLSGYTTWEQKIISAWFPVSSESFLFENFWPKHGPGSVADVEVAELLLKYKAMGSDARIAYLSNRIGESALCPVHSDLAIDRCSRVVFVPKSFDKLRAICMEPATLQWYQQGFLYSINKYVEKHPYLRRRIDLGNQELSRELARIGSIDGSLSTVDLSNASDRNTWNLVRLWTSKSSLRLPFMATRSTSFELPKLKGEKRGKRIETNKFAPMGSALCFPGQEIVYAAMNEATIFEMGGRPHGSRYRVVGDDQIIETKYVHALIKRLEVNGFVVNYDKTFTNIGKYHFRESCGGEYLNGRDVCPVRISRRFSGLQDLSRETPSRVSALVDLATTLGGHKSARGYVIAALNKLPQSLRPLFDEDGRKGVKSLQPTNCHLEKPKYNADLQVMEVKHGGLHKWEVATFEKKDGLRAERLSPDGLLLYRNTADEFIRFREWARLSAHRDQLLLPEDLIMAETILPGEPKWTKSTSAAGPHTVLFHLLREKNALKTIKDIEKMAHSLTEYRWVLEWIRKEVPESYKKIYYLENQVANTLSAIGRFTSLLEEFAEEKGKGC